MPTTTLKVDMEHDERTYRLTALDEALTVGELYALLDRVIGECPKVVDKCLVLCLPGIEAIPIPEVFIEQTLDGSSGMLWIHVAEAMAQDLANGLLTQEPRDEQGDIPRTTDP